MEKYHVVYLFFILNIDVGGNRKKANRILQAGTPTDLVIVEAIYGWIKEALFLDFGITTTKDVTNSLRIFILQLRVIRDHSGLQKPSSAQDRTGL